jgi:hypothetical protein
MELLIVTPFFYLLYYYFIAGLVHNNYSVFWTLWVIQWTVSEVAQGIGTVPESVYCIRVKAIQSHDSSLLRQE